MPVPRSGDPLAIQVECASHAAGPPTSVYLLRVPEDIVSARFVSGAKRPLKILADRQASVILIRKALSALSVPALHCVGEPVQGPYCVGYSGATSAVGYGTPRRRATERRSPHAGAEPGLADVVKATDSTGALFTVELPD